MGQLASSGPTYHLSRAQVKDQPCCASCGDHPFGMSNICEASGLRGQCFVRLSPPGASTPTLQPLSLSLPRKPCLPRLWPGSDPRHRPAPRRERPGAEVSSDRVRAVGPRCHGGSASLHCIERFYGASLQKGCGLECCSSIGVKRYLGLLDCF
jgi:hypothetical protein